MNELISVIIPVYNVKAYLENCINSVINQTYKKIEIIIVDDGSTDGSSQLCDQLAKKDSRIKVFHKKNGGLSDARNYGIDKAIGNFITFIDSDDVVSENLIAHLFSLSKRNNADISICNPIHIFTNKIQQNYDFQDPTKIRVLTPTQALNLMFYQNDFLVSAWGKLYRKSLFKDIKFPVGMLFEDIAIMYKLFFSSNKLVYSNAKYYGYFHRENSITTQSFSEKDFDILKICKSLDSFSKKHPELKDSIRCYIVNANFRIYLNAPKVDKYKPKILACEHYISCNAKRILKNSNVRKKLKIAIILFLINKKVLIKIYPKINRWK